MVDADSHGISRVPQYSGLRLKAQPFHLPGFHRLWPIFPDCSIIVVLCNFMLPLQRQLAGPTTPIRKRLQAITPYRFRLFPFRSPLLGESRFLSFPQGTKMFQFPWYPYLRLCIHLKSHQLHWWRLPHSDIRGSMGICPSPRLFAACHVLLRLLAPRHPPLALSNLTAFII